MRGDVDRNVDEHVRLAHIAADAGARVVVFPELSLTGYEIGLARDLAFAERDARLDPLAGVARSRSLTLVVGAPVAFEARLHIGAFILGPDGSLALYTKQRLGAFGPAASVDGVIPPAEATVFSPGALNPLVRLDGCTAAVAVCADIGRPSHPLEASARGADTYLASTFVIPSEFDREAATLGAYAARHSLVVACANYGGPSGGLRSAGRSAIWSDRGVLLVQLDAAGAGVAVAVEDGTGWHTQAIRARPGPQG